MIGIIEGFDWNKGVTALSEGSREIINKLTDSDIESLKKDEVVKVEVEYDTAEEPAYWWLFCTTMWPKDTSGKSLIVDILPEEPDFGMMQYAYHKGESGYFNSDGEEFKPVETALITF